MRLALVLVLGVIAVGCDAGERRAVVGPSGSGSAPGSATGSAEARKPVPLNAVCPPRALGPDPGPTKRDPAMAPPVGPPADTVDIKDQCVAHAQCTERGHGRCAHQAEHEVFTFGQRRWIMAHNECVYDECTSDDECRRTTTYEPRAESVCMCAEERNTCSFANCRVDSDCPSPFPCGGWHYCHSAADGCRLSSDCKRDDECVYSWTDKHYICKKIERIAPD